MGGHAMESVARASPHEGCKAFPKVFMPFLWLMQLEACILNSLAMTCTTVS